MNLQHFLMRSIPTPKHKEFFVSDPFPLDDEEIADIAINAMLLVMNNSIRATHLQTTRIDDYAPLVASGVRFPWKERIALSNKIDLLNDELPRYTAIGLTRRERNVFAQAVGCGTVDEKFLPKSARKALHGAVALYRATHIKGFDGLSRQFAGRRSNNMESITNGGYAGVMPDGIVIGVNEQGSMNPGYAEILAYAVSLHNDRKYFWEVTATEEFWEGFPAKAIFSIDEEYIKSLFYARSVPITATGRMRPILHWVSAHKRRMKEGVDIDIRKHLRGIDQFSMHGVNFDITEPRKSRPSNGSE